MTGHSLNFDRYSTKKSGSWFVPVTARYGHKVFIPDDDLAKMIKENKQTHTIEGCTIDKSQLRWADQDRLRSLKHHFQSAQRKSSTILKEMERSEEYDQQRLFRFAGLYEEREIIQPKFINNLGEEYVCSFAEARARMNSQIEFKDGLLFSDKALLMAQKARPESLCYYGIEWEENAMFLIFQPFHEKGEPLPGVELVLCPEEVKDRLARSNSDNISEHELIKALGDIRDYETSMAMQPSGGLHSTPS